MSHATGPAGLTPATADERAAIAAIDLDWVLATLDDLVRLGGDNGTESPGQRHVAHLLRDIGLDVDEWDIDLPTLATHQSFSAEVERTEALGVVGTWTNGPAHLMLNGHIDVVPVGDPSQWETPPWEVTVRNGNAHGRGTADMKGGLACALAALKAIRDAGVTPAATVSLASVVGEEDGGTGTLATIVRGHTADAAVIIEPTGGCVIPAHTGALTFRVTVPGQAAHGAVRDEGVSAVENFIPIHEALLELERLRNSRFRDPRFSSYGLPIGLSIGTVRAGEWSSTVPDTLEFEGRYGVAIGEDVAAARHEFEHTVAMAASEVPWLADHPPVVEWWGGQFAPGDTGSQHPIVTAVRDAHAAVTGSLPALRGLTAGTDLRLLVNDGGIPAVLYGPGDVRVAHTANEHVALADLATVTRALVVLILRFGVDRTGT